MKVKFLTPIILLTLASLAIVLIFKFCLDNKIDDFLKVTTFVIASFYFVYQAISGAFFATTSISLEAKRDETDTTHKRIIVKAVIERGDNWLVEIKEDTYSFSLTDPPPQSEQHKMNFPRPTINNKAVLRLAPKEKTQTEFVFDSKTTEGIFITAEIRYCSVGWEVDARSFAKVYVPPVS